MATRLKWLSRYFILVGILGVLDARSSLLDGGTPFGEKLIIFAIVSAYLYCGWKLKIVLPKWKRGIQVLIAFTIIGNLVTTYFAADMSTGFVETDTLGRIFFVLLLVLPTTFCAYIIYQIEILSKQLSQPLAETPPVAISAPLPPLSNRFYTNNYFLFGLPFVVVLINNISYILPYLHIPWTVIEVITIYIMWGSVIFACLYFLFGLYWLSKRRYKQAGLTFLGLTLGIVLEYMLITYLLTRLFGIE